MIVEEGQYEKGIYYVWCVQPHCGDCPGSNCPTTHLGLTSTAKCESAVDNLLGFAHR